MCETLVGRLVWGQASWGAIGRREKIPDNYFSRPATRVLPGKPVRGLAEPYCLYSNWITLRVRKRFYKQEELTNHNTASNLLAPVHSCNTRPRPREDCDPVSESVETRHSLWFFRYRSRQIRRTHLQNLSIKTSGTLTHVNVDIPTSWRGGGGGWRASGSSHYDVFKSSHRGQNERFPLSLQCLFRMKIGKIKHK